MSRWQQLVDTLTLAPHPEGGFYRETFRSPVRLDTPRGERSASTAIYFLLPPGTFSAWHRVLGGDEAWHLYEGALDLHLLDERGHRVVRLDADHPQAIVPAGAWQASVPVDYALCGCTVAPGFEFTDFEMPPADVLHALFPDEADVIEALTRG
ncbi:MAG: cupin domain-containing protein [Deltaproteobacteria bacterium]|nr:MAG: cupin domain-containing protein [Deltaproteobacteria bacterium]